MRMVFGLVLIVGLALAGAAVWMVQGYVSHAQVEVAREKAARLKLGELVDVFVVKKAMAYGAPITKDDVALATFPLNSLPPGTFVDAAILFPGDYLEPRYVLRQLEQNEPLLGVKVTEPGADISLTARLTKGKRAFAIKVDVASGVSGFVKPGDNVDVYWTGSTSGMNNEFTQLIETTIKVVAVDQAADGDRANVSGTIARTVTVEATPQQVARLAQATATGKLALSLVGTNDDTIVESVEVDSATLLGIQAAAPVAVEEVRQCSIKTRRGADVVDIPIPCTN
ncbi:pilus assembly protein CpaB [Pseudorhodobacter antarcticus]|uniref:Pilus assembly protein CpaB n=1 Tax=Pseudorhodobacter antarcticus TaxID=1077947 RepID=A0A1H8CTC5_9RHOB|nr:Flp pilus assembly protein CpaB [Pseudorhodobacter antarcticus]SEM97578.1 pilus assembly protein CpaB [Pseudorhodobacter antarcticus]